MIGDPKEKEYKVNNARCFIKFTLHMRLWQASVEKNIAHSIIDSEILVKDKISTLKEFLFVNNSKKKEF